jgi:hypothetical protein
MNKISKDTIMRSLSSSKGDGENGVIYNNKFDFSKEYFLVTFARNISRSVEVVNGGEIKKDINYGAPVNVITSVYKTQVNDIIDYRILIKGINDRNKYNLIGVNPPIVIFRIINNTGKLQFKNHDEFIELIKDKDNLINDMNDYDNVIIVEISIINILLDVLKSNDNKFLYKVFGNNFLSSYNEGFDLNKCLFIFEGFHHFYLIKGIFSLFNIAISGGGIVSRISPTTVQINLFNFLKLFNIYRDFDNKNI